MPDGSTMSLGKSGSKPLSDKDLKEMDEDDFETDGKKVVKEVSFRVKEVSVSKDIKKYINSNGWYIINKTNPDNKDLEITMRKCISCGKMNKYDSAREKMCVHCDFDLEKALNEKRIKVVKA